MLVKNAGDTYVQYVTNANWKTSQKEFVGWTQARFNETQWLPARAIGQFGIVKPWLDESQLAGGNLAGRFKVAEEFRVETVATPQDTGSLIAMAFNEFGEILASRENGPLLVLRGDAGSGRYSSVSIYCDEVKNIQGILPLNGQVFVVAEGPQGAGLLSHFRFRIDVPIQPQNGSRGESRANRDTHHATNPGGDNDGAPNPLPGAQTDSDENCLRASFEDDAFGDDDFAASPATGSLDHKGDPVRPHDAPIPRKSFDA